MKHPALIDPQKVRLPPLHIKLDLKKNFVKGMHDQGSSFQYLKKKYRGKLTDAKLEAGVFTGPEIHSVINDSSFPASLNKMLMLSKLFWEIAKPKTTINLYKTCSIPMKEWNAQCL